MSLDIVVYRAGQPWAEPKLDAFVAGLRKHRIEPEERRAGDWRVSDLAVVWAHRDTALHEIQRGAGNHYLVLERGYIGALENRRRWTSMGYDGLNGRADFCNAGAGPDRWDRYFAGFMQPWKDGGDYALLMGQVRGDASLAGIDIEAWYGEAAQRLGDLGWTVMFRPHPNDPTVAPDGAYALVGSLEGALASAAFVVTWNSTSGVDAVLAGVPTVAMDRGSMAWDVAAHSIEDVPFRPARLVWSARLAWTQWSDDELASGETWEHLRRKFD
jgi:hypothetical protein